MQPVLTGPVAGGSSIRKGGATATAVQSKSVWLGPVSGLFPVHATGPLNTTHTLLLPLGRAQTLLLPHLPSAVLLWLARNSLLCSAQVVLHRCYQVIIYMLLHKYNMILIARNYYVS